MALVPPYIYSALVAGTSGRFDIRWNVDLGFGMWRLGIQMRVAGQGASQIVERAKPGDRKLIAVERSYGRYIARVQPDDARPAYSYAAVLLDGHDGDNVKANIDLGFETWMRKVSVRLDGCNARELDEPGGPQARAYMADLAPAGTKVVLRSVKDDKYGGRYNGVVMLPSGRSLAELLIAGQWAAPWNGRGTKPVPPWPRTAT